MNSFEQISSSKKMSSHGRSQSYGSNGWISGTMEVISGMVPRPSTPQGLPSGSGPGRSISAPNSPARPGMFPGINRLPSQDSLDRSIHNESGHGKSTAQIIRDLKHANAALTAKLASQEAQFMNQMTGATRSWEDQRMKMDENIKKMKKQLAQLESFKSAAENELREKEAAVSKAKEESAYQRHTISEMKNELYQLQNELEEAQAEGDGDAQMPPEARAEMEQLLSDNQEMARELARLQMELRESERARIDLERGGAGLGRPPTPNSSGESPNSHYYQKFQETHSELEIHRKRLSVTQTTLSSLQAENENLQQEHAKTVEELQEELNKKSALFDQRERELQSQIESLEFTDSQVTLDLKAQLEQKDEAIADLQGQLEEYGEKVLELSSQLQEAQQAAANQESYRRDEAEDLRILHDAQEDEIIKLRKRLEDTQKELELREEELQESNIRSEKSVADSSPASADVAGDVEALRKELADAREKIATYEQRKEVISRDPDSSSEAEAKLKESLDNYEKKVKELESSVESLLNEKNEAVARLAHMEGGSAREASDSEDFSQLRSHWAGKADAVDEARKLQNEIEIHKQRATDATENERIANEKVQKLLDQVTNLAKDMDRWKEKSATGATDSTALDDAKAKITSLEKALDEEKARSALAMRKIEALQTAESATNMLRGGDESKTAEALERAQKEIAQLRIALEEQEKEASKTRKQLREAQIALVALDDEKKEMSKTHRELLAAVEKKKEEIQRDSDAKISTRDLEVQRLKQALTAKDGEIKKLQTVQQSLPRVQPVTPPPSSPARSQTDASDVSQLELTVKSLTREKDGLKVKLKDRDTTIAALVKSSVSLETKITSMENEINEVRSVQHDEKKVSEGELVELRRALSELQTKEPRMTEEITVLKKELHRAKQDAKRWKHAIQDDGNTTAEYRFQISLLQRDLEDSVDKVKERDEAIESLVGQSMTQDAHIKDLKLRISQLMKEVESLRSQRSRYDDHALKSEIRRLQQETEMFAGQIIEQDEELQNLKRSVMRRDEQLFSLKRELSEVKANGVSSSTRDSEMDSLRVELSRVTAELQARDVQIVEVKGQLEQAKQNKTGEEDSDDVIQLKAELDELREANAENRSELRDLRKQLWDAKQSAGETNDLKLELAQAKYALEEFKRLHAQSSGNGDDNSDAAKLGGELQSKLEAVERSANVMSEEQTAAFKAEIETLRNEIEAKNAELQKMQGTIAERDAALEHAEMLKLKLVTELTDTKDMLQTLKDDDTKTLESVKLDKERENLLKEKAELLAVRDDLAFEVEELKKKNAAFEEAQKKQGELELQLEKAKQAREASEKSIVDAYEKRLSAAHMEKDTVIEELRNDLAESRGQISQEANDMAMQLSSLQEENAGLREQFEVELQAKNQQIYALEHTLHAQEQIVESMRAEMDQLQSGMNHANEKRRGEVEDLQQELMQLEGRSLKQDREITALKMQLEESKLEHKAEVVRLKDVIANMETNPLAKTMADLQHDDRMLEVRERLEQLKARNTKLQEENLKLGGRLERKVIEVKSLEFEKDRAEEMEQENDTLRRQVKELQSILESSRPKTRSSSKSKPQTAQAAPVAGAPVISEPTSSTKTKDKKNKKGLKGLFKRRGFSSDDVIHEEA